MTIRFDDTKWAHALALCNKLMDIHKNIVHLAETAAIDLPKFRDEAHEWQHTVVDLQEAVYSLRRVPVKKLFSKLSRIVRELSKSLKKTINLQIEGTAIEVDSVLLDEIQVMLYDLVRNTAVQAIEPQEIRVQQDKPPEAVIHLKAYYEEEKVYIELSHDGSGLNFQNLRSIAIHTGYLPLPPKNLEMKDECDILAWVVEQKKHVFGLHHWDFEIQTPSQGTTFKFCAPRLIGDVTASEQVQVTTGGKHD